MGSEESNSSARSLQTLEPPSNYKALPKSIKNISYVVHRYYILISC